MPQTLELTATQLCQKIQEEWKIHSHEIPWGAKDYGRWTEWIKSTFHHIGERELKECGKKGVQWDVESTKLPDGRGRGSTSLTFAGGQVEKDVTDWNSR